MHKLTLRSFQILPLLLGISLASCATVTQSEQDRINQGSAIACAGFEAADTLFNSYAKSHPMSEDKLAIEAKVYAGVHEVCKPPYTLDLPTLMQKATNASVAIMDLMK